MKRTLIFLILSLILVLVSLTSEAQNKISIIDEVRKQIEFEKEITDEDKELLKKCQNWELSENDFYEIFSKCEMSTSEEIHGLYYWLPCYYETTVEYNGNAYTMEVNAASFIVIYNDDHTLYFGCSYDVIQKYFIIEATCCKDQE